MVTTDEVCKAFANGETSLRTKSMFIDKHILYSYGTHFPLAIRLNLGKEFKFILNNDKYSVTTSKHKTILLRHINKEDIVKEGDTGELQGIKEMGITGVKELMLENLKDEDEE